MESLSRNKELNTNVSEDIFTEDNTIDILTCFLCGIWLGDTNERYLCYSCRIHVEFQIYGQGDWTQIGVSENWENWKGIYGTMEE